MKNFRVFFLLFFVLTFVNVFSQEKITSAKKSVPKSDAFKVQSKSTLKKTSFWEYFKVKFSLGLQLNSFDQKEILQNYLSDVRDSIFTRDSLLVQNSRDSLIPNRGTVIENFDLIQILIPLRLELHLEVSPWFEPLLSLSYNNLNNFILSNAAILSEQSPSQFVNSNLTLGGNLSSSNYNFTASSLLLGTGFRIHISENIIYAEVKRPLFVQLEFLWNLGFSELNLDEHSIYDRRLFARVGYNVSVGTYLIDLWGIIGVESIVSLSSSTFRSEQSLRDLAIVNRERDYFNERSWSFTNLGVQFFFYYDPVIFKK